MFLKYFTFEEPKKKKKKLRKSDPSPSLSCLLTPETALWPAVNSRVACDQRFLPRTVSHLKRISSFISCLNFPPKAPVIN